MESSGRWWSGRITFPILVPFYSFFYYQFLSLILHMEMEETAICTDYIWTVLPMSVIFYESSWEYAYDQTGLGLARKHYVPSRSQLGQLLEIDCSMTSFHWASDMLGNVPLPLSMMQSRVSDVNLPCGDCLSCCVKFGHVAVGRTGIAGAYLGAHAQMDSGAGERIIDHLHYNMSLARSGARILFSLFLCIIIWTMYTDILHYQLWVGIGKPCPDPDRGREMFPQVTATTKMESNNINHYQTGSDRAENSYCPTWTRIQGLRSGLPST